MPRHAAQSNRHSREEGVLRVLTRCAFNGIELHRVVEHELCGLENEIAAANLKHAIRAQYQGTIPLDAAIANRPYGITRGELLSLVYADDVDGGPDIKHANAELAAQGYRIEPTWRGRFGGDVSVPLLGVDRRVEVKCRGNGFRQLYEWLAGADFLIVRADRREPLVVLPLKLAAEIAAKAEGRR